MAGFFSPVQYTCSSMLLQQENARQKEHVGLQVHTYMASANLLSPYEKKNLRMQLCNFCVYETRDLKVKLSQLLRRQWQEELHKNR